MANSENRIFTLAWDFPPIASGESIVCRRSLKYSEFNYDVCSGYCEQGNSVSELSNVQTYPVKGKYIKWAHRAVKLFIKLDKKNDYKVMISRVMPAVGHFVGLLIKCLKPELKWIVYFSDPIWNSPFISFESLFINDETHRPNYLLMKVFGIPAKIALSLGDLLVFNNERLACFILGKRYDKLKHKVIIAPYGHEGVKLENELHESRKREGKFILSHVGQVYGHRTFEILIDALEILKEKSPELYKKLEIHQVGFICEAEKKRIINSNVGERFQLIDRVDYDMSIELMRQADCLLIIDPLFKKTDCNIYVPAKIFDYMSTGKPILAIADQDSATADIMNKIEGVTASHDAVSVCRILEYILHDGIHVKNLQTHEIFHCKYGTEKLDKALTALFSESN